MKSIVLKRQVETVEETTLAILSPEIVMFFEWGEDIPQPPPVEPDPIPVEPEPEPEPIDPNPKADPGVLEVKMNKTSPYLKPALPMHSMEAQGKAEAVMVQYAERLLKKDQVYKLQMAISEDNFILRRVLSLHIGIFVEDGYEAFYTGEWRKEADLGVSTKYLRVQS